MSDEVSEEKICKHCKKSVKFSWDCLYCASSFHPSCAKQRGVVKQDQNSRDIVNCCQQPNNTKKTGEMDEKKMKAVFSELFKEYFNSFKKSVEKEFAELRKSVQYISDVFDEQKVAIDKLVSDVKKVTEEKESMKVRVMELESRLNDIEQREKEKNIIINGVPKLDKPNMVEIVGQIASSMNIQLLPDSVIEAYRLGKREDAPILAKFKRQEDKLCLFRRISEVKGLKAATCGFGGTNRIYLNDDLTLQNQKLLKKTAEFKNTHKFHSVYTRSGKIFLKKTKTDAPIRICGESDLKI